MIIGLHHVGIAVKDLEAAIKQYESWGFEVAAKSERPALRAVRALVVKGESRLELYQFEDATTELAQKIKKHTAFATDDLESDLQALLAAGYELALPIGDSDIVKRFVYVKDALDNFIELCEPLSKEA